MLVAFIIGLLIRHVSGWRSNVYHVGEYALRANQSSVAYSTPNRFTSKFSQALFEGFHRCDSCLSIKPSIICACGTLLPNPFEAPEGREMLLLFRSHVWPTIQHNVSNTYSTSSPDSCCSDRTLPATLQLFSIVYHSSSCRAQPSFGSTYFSGSHFQTTTFSCTHLKMRFATIATLFAVLAGQAIAGKWLHQYRTAPGLRRFIHRWGVRAQLTPHSPSQRKQ